MSEKEWAANITLTECFKALALSVSQEECISHATKDAALNLHKCLILMEQGDQDIVTTCETQEGESV